MLLKQSLFLLTLCGRRSFHSQTIVIVHWSAMWSTGLSLSSILILNGIILISKLIEKTLMDTFITEKDNTYGEWLQDIKFSFSTASGGQWVRKTSMDLICYMPGDFIEAVRPYRCSLVWEWIRNSLDTKILSGISKYIISCTRIPRFIFVRFGNGKLTKAVIKRMKTPIILQSAILYCCHVYWITIL